MRKSAAWTWYSTASLQQVPHLHLLATVLLPTPGPGSKGQPSPSRALRAEPQAGSQALQSPSPWPVLTQCVSCRAPLPMALRPPGQCGSPRPAMASCQGWNSIWAWKRVQRHPPSPHQPFGLEHWAGPVLWAAISRRLEHLGLALPAPARCPRPCSPAVLAGGALG